MANLLRFRPHPATSHRVFRTSKSQTWNKRRCVEHPANTPSPAPLSPTSYSLSQLPPTTHSDMLPQRPVIQSISCSSGLAPYHSSMIRADIAVKAIVIQCFCDRIHIQCSTGGRMCTFFKSIIQYLDISHMHKVDSSHCRIFCCHLCYIVVSGASKRTRTECDPIVSVIH